MRLLVSSFASNHQPSLFSVFFFFFFRFESMLFLSCVLLVLTSCTITFTTLDCRWNVLLVCFSPTGLLSDHRPACFSPVSPPPPTLHFSTPVSLLVFAVSESDGEAGGTVSIPCLGGQPSAVFYPPLYFSCVWQLLIFSKVLWMDEWTLADLLM